MRLFAALTLLALAPFTGELLLGNIPPDPVGAAFIAPQLILLYGGGALLIREVARRLRRGYPTMALLAVAYGLLEEGIVVGTLFNPDFLGLDLLDHGWVPALGTSPVWAVYVVGIHTVWSILVPIVLTEHLFPARGTTPWLRTPGLVLTILLYLLGAAALTLGTVLTYGTFPQPGQLAAVLALVLVAVALAVLLPRARHRSASPPGPALVALTTFLGGSAFIGVQGLGSPVVSVALMLVAITITAVLMGRASASSSWTPRHAVAAAGGAIATYCWAGFMVQISTYGAGAVAIVLQCAYVVIAAMILLLARRRALAADARPVRADRPGRSP